MRPSWDEYFMKITENVATRSTCLKRSVGAIIVKDKKILTTGYNGAPSNMTHCEDLGGCLREKHNIPSGERHELCRGLHAEQNAIIQAALHGVSIKGADLYVMSTPCIICAKMIINADIKKVYCMGEPYGETNGLELLKEAGVKIERL